MLPITVLDCYIEKTSIRREKNQASQLFSFIKLHNAVSPLVWAFLHGHDVGGIQNLIGTEIS